MNDDQLARNWAMGCHLAALAFYIGIPFGNILGPLIIWLIKKNEYQLVDEQGKEALNFQISVIIYSIVGAIAAVVFAITLIMIPIAVILGIAIALLFLFDLVITIVAAVKVANGEDFSYPLSLRLIK
jgi:uncharacterized Tic20 family protein